MYELTTEKGAISPKRHFDMFIERAIDESCLAVVQFSAAWCGPCRTLSAALTPYSAQLEAASECADEPVQFGKVDVEAEPELAAAYHVRGLPTVLFFRNGLLVHELRSGVTLGKIQQLVSQLTSEGEDDF